MNSCTAIPAEVSSYLTSLLQAGVQWDEVPPMSEENRMALIGWLELVIIDETAFRTHQERYPQMGPIPLDLLSQSLFRVIALLGLERSTAAELVRIALIPAALFVLYMDVHKRPSPVWSKRIDQHALGMMAESGLTKDMLLGKEPLPESWGEERWMFYPQTDQPAKSPHP